MATARTHSIALDGVAGSLVTIEADIHNGVPSWALTGLPDNVVAQSRDRCRAAIVNSGEEWPDRRVTVAMYPADVRKVGSHYDLAVAVSLLVANEKLQPDRLVRTVILGELALDGRVRAVSGVLPAVAAAVDLGFDRVIVAEENLAEAQLVDGAEVVAVRSLRGCVALLAGKPVPDEPPPAREPVPRPRQRSGERVEMLDLADVRGQAAARWCVEVAAAGGHHLSLVGPPGAGKTMLAERFPRLLPDLPVRGSIDVSKIHSVAGLLPRDEPRIVRPPFLAPHHNDTVASVIGGGSKLIRPGAVSLAHLGVLFMDEAPEFKPSVHDALRQPLESGRICIRRADAAAWFPASFQLILAANPCPCGYGYGKGVQCRCAPDRLRRYQARISGPIRDRIDITHTVAPISRAEMRTAVGADQTSAAVADRVLAARLRQRTRYAGLPWQSNAEAPAVEFRRRAPIGVDAATLIEDSVADGRLTQRGADRVARLAWTLADLDAMPEPTPGHVLEGLRLRTDGLVGGPIQAARGKRGVGHER
jgi:magnesium chelatase family protein